MKKFEHLNAFDFFIGLEECKPLLTLFCKAFVLYKTHKSVENFDFLFAEVIKDNTSSSLYSCINEKSPLLENSYRNKIRIAILILDNEISHNLIFMLTGLDVRAILVIAHVITEEFFKIIFDIDINTYDQTTGDTIEYVIGKELQLIKTCIKKN